MVCVEEECDDEDDVNSCSAISKGVENETSYRGNREDGIFVLVWSSA